MITEILKVVETRLGQYVVWFLCDSCGTVNTSRKSHFDRKKRHFCDTSCYSWFRKCLLPKNEQHAYKNGGMGEEERSRRIKCRSDTNHAIYQNKLTRLPCEKCGETKAEAHHDNYDKPFEIRWFCFKHHREFHHENPELI